MFKKKDPSQSIGLQFWSVYSQWQLKVLSCLKPLNITHTQFVILTAILWSKKQNKMMTQANVVSITGIDKMTLSKSLKILVAKDLVIKNRNENDSRSFVLCLSNEGGILTKQALTLIESLDDEFFGSIGRQKEDEFRDLLLAYRKYL